VKQASESSTSVMCTTRGRSRTTSEARGTEVRPGSVFWGPQYANGANRTTDQTPTDVRFRKYKGELQLWFTSEDNGFQIVKFSDTSRRSRRTC